MFWDPDYQLLFCLASLGSLQIWGTGRQLVSEVYYFADKYCNCTVLHFFQVQFCSRTKYSKLILKKCSSGDSGKHKHHLPFFAVLVCSMWREGHSGTDGTGEILRGDNLLSAAWEPHRDQCRIAGRNCSAAQAGRKRREITRLSWLDFNLGKCRGIVSSIIKKCNTFLCLPVISPVGSPRLGLFGKAQTSHFKS